MTEASLTISDRIQNKLDDLTRAERQLATWIEVPMCANMMLGQRGRLQNIC